MHYLSLSASLALHAWSHGITAYQQVDALEFYKERIQALADAIKKGSDHLLRDPDATLPAAFVTFKTRTAQVLHLSLW